MTDSEHLYQLIEQKLKLLEQLAACSGNQMQYVDAENLEALLEILAAKQRMLLEIEGIDRQITGYHVDNPDDRVWPSQEMRSRCREMVSQCDQLVREALANDQLAEQQLMYKKNAVKQQLLQVSDKIRVQGAYRQQKQQPGKPAHCHIDLGSG